MNPSNGHLGEVRPNEPVTLNIVGLDESQPNPAVQVQIVKVAGGLKQLVVTLVTEVSDVSQAAPRISKYPTASMIPAYDKNADCIWRGNNDGLVVTSSVGGEVKCWDASNPVQWEQRPMKRTIEKAKCLVASDSGNSIAFADYERNTLVVYDIEQDQWIEHPLGKDFKLGDDYLSNLVLSPAGDMLLLQAENKLLVFEARKNGGKPTKVKVDRANEPGNGLFLEDDTLFVEDYMDEVIVYDTESWKEIRRVKITNEQGSRIVSMQQIDGMRLFVGMEHDDGATITAGYIDIGTGEAYYEETIHHAARAENVGLPDVVECAVSPNKNYVASIGRIEGDLNVIRLSDGECILSTNLGDNQHGHLEFIDNQHIAVTHDDGSVYVFEIPSA